MQAQVLKSLGWCEVQIPVVEGGKSVPAFQYCSSAWNIIKSIKTIN